MSWPRTSASAVLVMCWLGITGASAQPLTFFDGEFNGAGWAVTICYSYGPAGHSVAQSVDGGNPGAYRQMHHHLFGPPAAGLWIFHGNIGAVYAPTTQGAIDFIEYSEDRFAFDPPFSWSAVAGGPALQQNGVVYMAPGATFTAGPWESYSHVHLTAADFDECGPGTSSPDFSSEGGQIHFGFFRANSTNGETWSTHHGIDNWSVTVHPVPPPCNGDFDSDNDVDADDFDCFANCMGGPDATSPEGCDCADFDGDGDADLDDFAAFQVQFTGPLP